MATRKKAKRTVKRRPAAVKPTGRRKAAAPKRAAPAAKKPAVRRAAPAKAKPALAPNPVPKPAPSSTSQPAPASRGPAQPRATSPISRPAAPAQSALPGERVGVVTHYYGHLSVAVVRLETGRLRVGDWVHIRGYTSDFTQRVESLQVEHQPVTEVGPNDDFALRVIEHAREHDVVYKLAP